MDSLYGVIHKSFHINTWPPYDKIHTFISNMYICDSIPEIKTVNVFSVVVIEIFILQVIFIKSCRGVYVTYRVFLW